LPGDALLHVDGKSLGAGVREVERPVKGVTTTVVITAQGFADETVKLDETTPSSLEVAMTLDSPKPTMTAAPDTQQQQQQQQPQTSSTQPATTSSHKIALPANPY
jgi:hypothetical protein